MTLPEPAKQGHRYLLDGEPVLALESGPRVKVLHFNEERPWVGFIEVVPAVHLVPQPLRYLHGQLPK